MFIEINEFERMLEMAGVTLTPINDNYERLECIMNILDDIEIMEQPLNPCRLLKCLEENGTVVNIDNRFSISNLIGLIEGF